MFRLLFFYSVRKDNSKSCLTRSFGVVGYLIINKLFELGSDPDRDRDTGIFGRFFCHSEIGDIVRISRQTPKIMTTMLRGWPESLSVARGPPIVCVLT